MRWLAGFKVEKENRINCRGNRRTNERTNKKCEIFSHRSPIPGFSPPLWEIRSPDAYRLPLFCQMDPSVKVECLDRPSIVVSKVPLGAAIGSLEEEKMPKMHDLNKCPADQVPVVASQLSGGDQPRSEGRSRAAKNRKLVARTAGANIH